MADDPNLYDILERVAIRSYNTRYAPKFDSLIISYCNATLPCAFSNAFIDFKSHFVSLNVISLFANAFIALADETLLKNGMLEKLKSAIKETKHIECLRALMLKTDADRDVTKVRNTLAAHYFQPLAYGGQCIVDKGSPAKCENCGLEVNVSDTSMGSSKSWHGRADIVVNKSTVKVGLMPLDEEVDDDQDQDFTGGEQSITYAESPDNPISQALAEGIVNAFCESKRDNSLYTKFIPSFLTTETNIRIILYNCDLDILFLSDTLEIWESNYETLNHDTLVLIWMALNFENFEMKLDDEMMKVVKTSNFQNILGKDFVDMYLNDLSKPCPVSYMSRITTTTPQDDGTFFLATQNDNHCYNKIMDALGRKRSDPS